VLIPKQLSWSENGLFLVQGTEEGYTSLSIASQQAYSNSLVQQQQICELMGGYRY